jgi:hypothetical protein
MLRSCKYVAAWMAAAAIAVSVSWLGVRVGLAPALTSEAPVAIDVNRRYTEVRLGAAEVAPSPSASRTSSRPKPSRSVTAAATAAASSKPTTTKRPAPKVTTTAPATSRPTSPSPSPAEAEDQTEYEISADGGTVIVAYSASRIDPVDADPLSGYVASYNRRSATNIVIRLDGPSHSSVITAYWLDGPVARIAEEFTGF